MTRGAGRLCLAVWLGAQLGLPGIARAQQAAPAPAAAEETARGRAVTGTRLPRRDLTTPAPLVVLTREQLAASGKASLGDFLQSLPEQGNALNAQYNSGGDGSSSIDLRSLGAGRTLVLVNGRRFPGGGSNALGIVDLYAIPSAVVERIEILKDGASALYGSDAIAGVVNVITRKNLDASEVSAYGGTSSRGDGQAYDLAVTTGTSSDRGSVLFSAGYSRQKPVWAGSRPYGEKIRSLDFATGQETVIGSSAVPMGRFTLDTAAPACQADPQCAALGAGGTFLVDPSAPGGARPYSAADAYNTIPDGYLFTPGQRFSLFSSGDANLGSAARGYFEASYVNRESDQKLAPTPLFTSDYGVPFSASSMYNPYGVDLFDVRRRLVEFGKRDFRQDMDTVRFVAGVDGSLQGWAGPLRGWSWDTSFNWGRTSGIDSTNGTLRLTRVADALGPSMLDPTTGLPTCVRTPGDITTAIDGCTPINLLGGVGTITPEQVAGLAFYGADRHVNELASFQASVGGELFRIRSDRPVGLALGYEYRAVHGASLPNPITAANENVGNNFPPTRGGYDVHEGYAELVVPLVGDRPGADDLEVSGAFRAFRYSTFGSDSTYALGARYRPVRDVTLRGTYSTAFRAPNVTNLYGGATEQFPAVVDPCSGGFGLIDPASPLGQRCGAAVNNGDDRTAQRAIRGGSPDLQAETAKVYTLGVVLEPSLLRSLTVTVGYYDIDLTGSIGSLTTPVILDSCYRAGSARHCERVHRLGPAGFQRIDFIDDRAANAGEVRASGIDVAARYRLSTGVGRFDLAVDGTYLLRHDVTLPSGTVLHHRGNYDGQLAMPSLRVNAGLTWSLRRLGAGLGTRFVGAYEECATAGGIQGGTCSGNPSALRRDVSAWSSFDLFASYDLPSSLGRSGLAVGVTNVLDASPPRIYANTTYGSDPSTYDFVGRFLYVRLGLAY